MGVRLLRHSRVAFLLLAVGCHLPGGEVDRAPSVGTREGYAPGTLVALSPATVVRGAPPAVPPVSRAPAVPPPLPTVTVEKIPAPTPTPAPAPAVAQPAVVQAVALLPQPTDFEPEWVAAGSIRTLASAAPKLRPPTLVREQVPPVALPRDLPPITEPPGELPPRPAPVPGEAQPVASAQPAPVSPGEFLPPIPPVPDAPAPPVVKPKFPMPPARTSDTPPAALPLQVAPQELPPTVTVAPPVSGVIDVNGKSVTFDSLSQLVDRNGCSHCGGGAVSFGSCSACGDPPCRAGKCEPFPAKTAVGRVIGLVYSSMCCPDPCYQPKWEPITDAAFFVDSVRPKTSTRFRWDYGSHFAYPDRGEYFFARGDGNGKGPRANAPLRAIPYADYHELMLITEAASGSAGVQIAVPYRSVNSTPFGADGAGFSDMQITAKTLLLDSELAMFGFQMRTYVPIGQPAKGLGTGHVSLEPGLNFGLRLAPQTYFQGQVVEWIPIGGDPDYQGAHLRWGMSLNHVLWQPIRDVRLIGTLETTGISFQDGLFTDPALGAQRLTRRTSAAIGPGMRLFFCDTFDFGAGWQHGITGKYLIRDQVRFEIRYRF